MHDQSLLDEPSPALEWERNSAHRALDDLFSTARHYMSSAAYRKLIEFIGSFRFYAPYNAMLVHVQMPGAAYVAPAYRWLNQYRRHIKAGARPLVILQPMGPVMFVFDVGDTEPEKDAPRLPREVEHPFEPRKGFVCGEDMRIIENGKRDGVNVTACEVGTHRAGSIQHAQPGRTLRVQAKFLPEPEYVEVPMRYDLVLNAKHSPEARYATLAHELAHLYCGHLGTPNDKWWPDRRGLDCEVCEFEAESVCYLLCARLGIDNPSDEYLAGYLKGNSETPEISLDCVMKAAGLIEQMGRGHLQPRKKPGQ